MFDYNIKDKVLLLNRKTFGLEKAAINIKSYKYNYNNPVPINIKLEDLIISKDEDFHSLNYTVKLVNPNTKPECGADPNLLRSRYHQYSSGSRLLSFSRFNKIS